MESISAACERKAAVTLAYVAGLFDGEGSVNIHVTASPCSPYHTLVVGIANTDRQIIEWLRDEFGGTVMNNTPRSNGKQYKTCLTWRLASRQAARFLTAIQPYARIKAEQIAVALAFDRLPRNGTRRLPADMLEEREEHRRRLRALKQR